MSAFYQCIRLSRANAFAIFDIDLKFKDLDEAKSTGKGIATHRVTSIKFLTDVGYEPVSSTPGQFELTRNELNDINQRIREIESHPEFETEYEY